MLSFSGIFKSRADEAALNASIRASTNEDADDDTAAPPPVPADVSVDILLRICFLMSWLCAANVPAVSRESLI